MGMSRRIFELVPSLVEIKMTLLLRLFSWKNLYTDASIFIPPDVCLEWNVGLAVDSMGTAHIALADPMVPGESRSV